MDFDQILSKQLDPPFKPEIADTPADLNLSSCICHPGGDHSQDQVKIGETYIPRA